MNAPDNPNIDPGLLIRFLSGEADEPEQQQVRTWMQADLRHQQYYEEMALLWQKSADAKDFSGINTAEDWKKVEGRIKVIENRPNGKLAAPTQRWLYSLIRVAAVVLIVFGLAIGLNDHWRQTLFKQTIEVAATTAPKALTLPDGTRVFLNQQSRIAYPKKFTGKTREVTLTGEAFFEVIKNPEQPFVITSGAVVTRVLGTSFNVHAMAADSVTVTVLTGKVALYMADAPAYSITMQPGERGSYQRGNLIKSPNMDANFLAWKTGTLTFRNTPLPIVIRDLNRHYHQQLQLGSSELENCRLTSVFRHQTLEEVLAEIRLILPVQISRKGQTLLITGPGC